MARLRSTVKGIGEHMRVLAMASQKGGSGKTTLSGHLAEQAHLAGQGPVVLIDIDPQGSLADWWNEREAEQPAFAQTTVARLAADLESALAGQHVSVVNVSGNRALFRLSGDGARATLEKGCSLDLHPRAFFPGRAAQTLVARAQVLLVQRDTAPTYHIMPRRSFAAYIRSWLEDAAHGR